jgi:hypothetical protein
MSDPSKIKVEFPTWNSLSKELQTIIKNGMSNAKVWCLHALDFYNDSRDSLASEMSIQFEDSDNENKFYYIQLSEDQTPHTNSDPFYFENWTTDNKPIYTNNKPVCLKTLNAWLVYQDKFPYEPAPEPGPELNSVSTIKKNEIKLQTRNVESTLQTERICPVVVRVMVNDTENISEEYIPIVKDERLDGYDYGEERNNIYNFSFEIKTTEISLKEKCTDDELDQLNKLGFVQTRYAFDYYDNRYTVPNRNFLECVYLKCIENIPENLINLRGSIVSSPLWIKIPESFYSFDGNDLILSINDIESNFNVNPYNSQISILFDAEKLKSAGIVEEVTGELSIIQSPWLFASSEMDYVSYYSNSPFKQRYPAVKAMLGYNTLKLLHNNLNYSTKRLEPEDDIVSTVFFADAVEERGLRFVINGKRYGIVGFKELPTESTELIVNEDLIRTDNDLTLRFSGTNSTVTAYVYEIPEEDDITYSPNIIKLCFNKSFYTAGGSNNGVTPVMEKCFNTSSINTYYCHNLYTSESTTDSSTQFVLDPTKQYTLLDINCYGVLVEANTSPSNGLYHSIRGSRSALTSGYSGDYCIEMQNDSKVFLGNASYYETKLFHYVLYYLVEDAD